MSHKSDESNLNNVKKADTMEDSSMLETRVKMFDSITSNLDLEEKSFDSNTLISDSSTISVSYEILQLPIGNESESKESNSNEQSTIRFDNNDENFDNRLVEFYSIKPMQNIHEIVDDFYLHLENYKDSGGGKIESYSLDPDLRHWTATYKDAESAENVLKKEVRRVFKLNKFDFFYFIYFF